MPRATPDNANPLAVFTTRELLTNRAMARKRRKAATLVAKIDAELDRRRGLRADRLYGGLPAIPALDETSWRRD